MDIHPEQLFQAGWWMHHEQIFCHASDCHLFWHSPHHLHTHHLIPNCQPLDCYFFAQLHHWLWHDTCLPPLWRPSPAQCTLCHQFTVYQALVMSPDALEVHSFLAQWPGTGNTCIDTSIVRMSCIVIFWLLIPWSASTSASTSHSPSTSMSLQQHSQALLLPENLANHHLLPFANNFGTLIYVVFLACIFVELFLNKECTYLDDFWF